MDWFLYGWVEDLCSHAEYGDNGTAIMVGWYHYGVLQLKQEKMLFTAHCTLSHSHFLKADR